MRRAIEVAPQQVGRFIELARFLARQGRYQEADQSFARAEKIAPDSPQADVRQSRSVHQDTGKNLELAREFTEALLELALTARRPAAVGGREAAAPGAGS